MNKKEYSKEDIKQMVSKALEKLEKGVEEVFTSGKYLAYLRMLSKFHTYSFSNTVLIFLQRPEATNVAGYKTWLSLKRHVNKGEKGIQILAPQIFKKTVEKDKVDVLTGKAMFDKNGNKIKESKIVNITTFKPIYIFDYAQTSGEPLPTLASELKEKLENKAVMIDAIKNVANVPIEFQPLGGNANGYYDLTNKKIVVKSGMSDSQTLKTLIHELAHSRLCSEGKLSDERSVEEIRAESISFVVMENFNIDTSEYSFGYVASWSKNKELDEFKKSLAVIQSESNKIINEINNELMPEKNQERFSVVKSMRDHNYANTSNKASEKLPTKQKSMQVGR